MSLRIDDGMVERLRDIGENLDTLNLGDTKAWEALAEELAKMIWGLPETHSDLERLLRYCRKGIIQIAERTSANCLALVGAVAEALETIERLAGEEAGGKGVDIAPSNRWGVFDQKNFFGGKQDAGGALGPSPFSISAEFLALLV